MRLFLRKTSILLMLAMVAWSTFADDANASRNCSLHPHFPAFSSGVCTNNALKHDNQMQLDYCAYSNFEKANNILNRRYNDLMSSRKYPLVITAETSWIKYRDRWCRAVVNNIGCGSAEIAVKYRCLANLTEEQNNNLKSEYGFYHQNNKTTVTHNKYKKLIITSGKYYLVPKGYEWVIKDEKRIPCGRACTADLYVKGEVLLGHGKEYSVNNGNFNGSGGHISISFNKKQRSHMIILGGSLVQVGDSEQRMVIFQKRTKN